MKNKFVISSNRNFKLNWLKNNVSLKDLILVYYGEKPEIACEKFDIKNINSNIQFLDFYPKVSNKILVFLDVLRHSKPNATTYNKLYRLSESASNIVILDSLPFVFNRKNIYVPLKLIGVNKYHVKQFYDDNFYETSNGRNVKANSTENLNSFCKEDIICDLNKAEFATHEWSASKEELEFYEKFKKELIYDKCYNKVKVVTWLQGESNRFKSKLDVFTSILEDTKKYLVVTNWEKAINMVKGLNKSNLIPISYHQPIPEVEFDEVIFLETIISQKIKFYDLLKNVMNKPLHFFINNQLGADKKVVSETVNIVNELNNFTSYEWSQS